MSDGTQKTHFEGWDQWCNKDWLKPLRPGTRHHL